MVKVLTDAAVRKYTPGPKRRIIRDGAARSLFLVVQPSGHRSWMMRFRTPSGRIAKLTLGPLHTGSETAGPAVIGMPLTLAGARQLAAEVHRERAQGRDVAADRRAQRHRQRAELEERSANTFAAAARMFIEEYARPKTRRWLETARLLGLRYSKDGSEPEQTKGGLVERWADKPVRDIDGHDIWSVVDEARRLGVPGIKPRRPGLSEARPRALFAALSALFSRLQEHRRVETNPCAGVHQPGAPKARERVLTNDEIRWFWKACVSVDAPRAPGAPRPFASLLRLLLLTGARLNEVAGMTRAELSRDGQTWTIPGERVKNHRTHVVPLPPLARELTASVQAKSGATDLVFTTTDTTPVSGWSRVKRRLDAAMLAVAREERGANVVIPPWRLHDLRRTAVTGMAELGIRPDVIELVVNHVSGSRGGIAGVYNRSELLPERHEALERWSRHVMGVAAPRSGNVVKLRRKR
jgi:integrase